MEQARKLHKQYTKDNLLRIWCLHNETFRNTLKSRLQIHIFHFILILLAPKGITNALDLLCLHNFLYVPGGYCDYHHRVTSCDKVSQKYSGWRLGDANDRCHGCHDIAAESHNITTGQIIVSSCLL